MFPVIVLLFVSVSCIAQASLKKAAFYAKTISPERLKENLTILAGPGMEGRETGTPGQVKAAAYIEQEMKQAGLLPAVNGSYHMPFPIYRDSVINAALSINNIPLTWKKDFAAPASNFISKLSFSELTFVNTEDSAWKKNKIDVSGKLVLVYTNKPKEPGGHSPVTALIANVTTRSLPLLLVI